MNSEEQILLMLERIECRLIAINNFTEPVPMLAVWASEFKRLLGVLTGTYRYLRAIFQKVMFVCAKRRDTVCFTTRHHPDRP